MENGTISGQFRVTKVQPEKRLAFGWAYVTNKSNGEQMEDHSGDIVDIAEIEKAAYNYVKLYRDGSDNHERGGAATLVESMVFNKEKAEALGIPPGSIPTGWWIGFEVTDEEVWKKVKSGEYAMFSIEGAAKRIPV